jgi:hypothetical protein
MTLNVMVMMHTRKFSASCVHSQPTQVRHTSCISQPIQGQPFRNRETFAAVSPLNQRVERSLHTQYLDGETICCVTETNIAQYSLFILVIFYLIIYVSEPIQPVK